MLLLCHCYAIVYLYLELDIEQDEVFMVWAGAGPKRGIVNEANV